MAAPIPDELRFIFWEVKIAAGYHSDGTLLIFLLLTATKRFTANEAKLAPDQVNTKALKLQVWGFLFIALALVADILMGPDFDFLLDFTQGWYSDLNRRTNKAQHRTYDFPSTRQLCLTATVQVSLTWWLRWECLLVAEEASGRTYEINRLGKMKRNLGSLI